MDCAIASSDPAPGGSTCRLLLRLLGARRKKLSISVAVGVACAIKNIVASLRRAYGHAADAVAVVVAGVADIVLDVAAAVLVKEVGVIVGEVVGTYVSGYKSCALLARRNSSHAVGKTGAPTAEAQYW